jgi:hypothetical protein
MNTTEQAEFLERIMHELDSDPAASTQDKPLLKSEPEKLCAGYEAGYYYIKINLNTKISTIAKLQGAGYTLHLLKPPFAEPIMLKKRD